VTNEDDVISFFLVGKTVENFFGSSAHHYVYEKKYSNGFVIVPPMIAKLSKSFIFQRRFNTFKAEGNRCYIIICKVFDDVSQSKLGKLNQHTPSSTSPTLIPGSRSV